MRVTKWRRRAWGLAAGMLLGAMACVALVGPWPVYRTSRYGESIYYRQAMAAVEAGAKQSGAGRREGLLRAGWAAREITPPVGTPMAGYSAREDGKRSTGVKERLWVRAVALSDGADTALIIVADMLIIPPAIAGAVRVALSETPGIDAGHILFNATHTHCGPGAFAPGWGARITGGEYDPKIEAMLAEAMIGAAREALGAMGPVTFAEGSAHAPEFIENRVRAGGPVDPELSFMALRGADGRDAILVSYNAHATVHNRHMTEFSRDYPGALQDFLKERTGAEVIFLSGAVGSMGDRRPEAATREESVAKMGRGLGRKVAAGLEGMTTGTAEVDVAAFGFSAGMPPIQVRPVNAKFRLSPWLAGRVGVKREGWVQFVKLGDVVLVGMPFDFSGETSLDWKAWGAERGVDVWPTSFSGDYCGYQSPDRYYMDEPLDYETGQMSWFGPELEAYVTEIFEKGVEGMIGAGEGAGAGASGSE